MAIRYQCDYCGESIEGLMLTIKVSGERPRAGGRIPEIANGYIGHYHSEPDYGELSCYERVLDAIRLAHDFGPTLETIETISPQAVAHRRRRMNGEG